MVKGVEKGEGLGVVMGRAMVGKSGRVRCGGMVKGGKKGNGEGWGKMGNN